MLRPRIALPFLLVATIWGSTWWVITDQIDGVPAPWSVVWRFSIAMPAMFLLARVMGKPLGIGRRVHLLAMGIGLTQFCGNFNFVYHAEMHLTSGIVALLIGMMLVPNAILGRIFLDQPVTPRFVFGSAVAITGIALLLVHEWREESLGGNVGLGIVLAVAAMLCASVANVAQANTTGRSVPMVSLLAWSMLYGLICDVVFAAAAVGAPVLPDRPTYWLGTAYLALAGSIVTFPLYFTLVRELGPGRAAYNGVLVVIIAMMLSTLLEGYVWSPLAGLGAAMSLAGLIVALRARKPVAKSG
nr:DMT family transporter [Novosphingobium marinum]